MKNHIDNSELIKLIPEIKKYIKSNFQIDMMKLKKDDEIIKKIISLTDFITYDEKDLKFTERFYCLRNNIKKISLCENEKCKDILKFKNGILGYGHFCSLRCGASSDIQLEKRKKTNLEKYGSISPLSNEKIKDKIKKVNLEKYGHENPMGNAKNREKAKKTMLKKYGYENPFQSKDVQNNILNTNLKKYGYKYPLKNTFVKNKMIKTWNNKSEEELNKIYSKMRCTWSNKTEEEIKLIILKREKKSLEKYNVPYSIQKNIINYNDYFDKKFWEENFITENNNLNIDKIIKYFNISQTRAYRQANLLNINWVHFNSRMESDLKYIFNLNDEFIQNSQKIISPLELDFINLNYNLAIEINGLYWHSYGLKNTNDNQANFNYCKYRHLNKTELCEEKNIQLLHINENEIKDNNLLNIWKSIISIKTKQNVQKIFARKCTIKEVPINVAKIFCEVNHLQGYVNSSIRIGLYYKDELVSLSTFGKSRFDKNIEYELIRFCTKLNYIIVGGASKLLKYFERNYKPQSLISYANRRWSQGKLYEKIGFSFIKNTKPGFNIIKNLNIYSRQKFQKHRLQKIKNFNYDDSLSVVDNIINNGYRYMFDSGNKVYVKYYCYFPNEDGTECGKCGSCLLKEKALDRALSR